MKRLLSTMLLISMLAALATSCNGGNGTEDTGTGTDNSETTTAQIDPAAESIRFDLDPSLNYNKKAINVLSYQSYFEGSNEDGASALSRSKYNQRANTEERLNVQFSNLEADPWVNVSSMVTQSINSQTDDYQIVFGGASNVVGLVNSGYFTSINDLAHVDTDKAWWNLEYSKSVSINSNSPYVLFGDINYNMIERTTAMLFNKDLLLERHGMTDSQLYDIVLDGEWTIDKFVELATGIYEDDGDNETYHDIDDLHGVAVLNNIPFNFTVFSAGVSFTERDEAGYPVIADAPTERMITIVDKLLPVFTGLDTFDSKKGSYHQDDYINNKFAAGTALFSPNRLYVAGWDSVIEMEDNYGIIPMPKYDDTIDGYHSVVGGNVIWCLVPALVKDVDMVSAVLESLAYEGYKETTPTYFENNLKLKYTRGDDVDTESQIIDLIRDGAVTDFLFVNALGGIGNIFATCYDQNSNILVSEYAANYVVAQQTLTNIIEQIEN